MNHIIISNDFGQIVKKIKIIVKIEKISYLKFRWDCYLFDTLFGVYSF